MTEKYATLIVQQKLLINRIAEVYDLANQAIRDESKHEYFKARWEAAQGYYEEFEALHRRIIFHEDMNENRWDEEEKVRVEVDEKYFSAKSIFSQLIKTEIIANASVPLASSSPVVAHQNCPPPINVNLPKLTLPVFEGDLKQWPTFFDLFQTLIHKKVGLSDTEKFQYLLSFVKGEPLKVIKAIPLTDANYQIAYNTLKDRYQNKRLLASTYLNEIFNLPKISNGFELRNMFDSFIESVDALSLLGFPVSEWDFILLNLLLQKLDSDTVQRFELAHSHLEMPHFNQLKLFISNQCKALETISYSNSPTPQNKQAGGRGQKGTSRKDYPQSYLASPGSEPGVGTLNPSRRCSVCGSSHLIYSCSVFLSKSPRDRFQLCKQHKMCVNCLSTSHSFSRCKSNSTCRICHSRHHSLLHFESDIKSPTGPTSVVPQTPLSSPINSPHTLYSKTPQVLTVEPSSPVPASSNSNTNSFSTSCLESVDPNSLVLLATALVNVIDSKGNPHCVRVLLDSASQATFISKKCFNRLGLFSSKLNIPIKGIGELSTITSRGLTSFSICPVNNRELALNLEAIILPKVCSDMPTMFFNSEYWNHVKGLPLADPSFNVPGEIDLLLGASMFPHILLPGKIVGEENSPVALNTIFGWVLMGKISLQTLTPVYTFSTFVDDLTPTLKRFWEIEEVPQKATVSVDDSLAERSFVDTHRRAPNGQFIVSLPFKQGDPLFTDVRSVALRRFYNLEKRLHKYPDIYKSYCDFMHEYVAMGHMEVVSSVPPWTSPQNLYYIPHHSVINPNSSTTKLRVVFDASAKSYDGKSLNETLFSGPKLQQDINAILLNFRRYPIAFTADIKMMYRQIWVDKRHWDYQRIVWRFNSSEPVRDYVLKTVTYGVSSSPFLALRCILELAQKHATDFPMASQVLQNQIFVDDIVKGADSLSEALSMKEELIQLLKLGGFELRKWSSNNQEFLSTIPSESHQSLVSISLDDNEASFKVLGLRWCPQYDIFSYEIKLLNSKCTKRSILSELARIYDPLGFLAPVMIALKLLMQHLWVQGVNWDDPAPADIVDKWSKYKSDLNCLSNLRIPRHCFLSSYLAVELHGFGDASNLGYAACLYLRFSCSNHTISTFLVYAKSKVAPLKRLSVPRLELCAALLVANLMKFVLEIYSEVKFTQIYAWSDSMVSLAWIRSPSYRWKSFVANRVSQIQEIVAPERWGHVASEFNPADCATRGMLPSDLCDASLWWHGPDWLSLPNDMWPPSKLPDSKPDAEASSEEAKLVFFVATESDRVAMVLNKYSSLQKILRIFTYCLRFVTNLRNKSVQNKNFTEGELHATLMVLVAHSQKIAFSDDIDNLSKGRRCSNQLRKLSPFLDDLGVLRVGGRLVHSKLSFEHKHPALLPSDHRLTELLIEDFHIKYLHCGKQTLHYLILQQFWILSAKNVIRRLTSKCLKCFRVNPPAIQPRMGDLPTYRVTQSKPFQCSAVDFGGPFHITLSRSRGVKSQKAYLCLFVCCATKALHLELVSDLTTSAFLAALRRFISRRGRVSVIHSDCGTNFVGAAKYLHEVFAQATIEEKIEWRFNPPAAPHFGGLWEAGIKSVKYHLIRLIGDQILSYEEFYTLLTQIEAILNSRPLSALSNDPNDLSSLTPGHFLTMAPLSTIPDPDLSTLNVNRLSRWQLLQHFHHQFWQRWQREYLHTLQQRNKWFDDDPKVNQVKAGVLVVIRDELTPPLKWRLGRISELHPGPDGLTRVVTIRTANGMLKRPVTKISILPSQ